MIGLIDWPVNWNDSGVGESSPLPIYRDFWNYRVREHDRSLYNLIKTGMLSYFD
jgi:hypothetical protein